MVLEKTQGQMNQFNNMDFVVKGRGRPLMLDTPVPQ